VEQAKLNERLARLEKGVERGLELLGGGRADEARAVLSELLAPPPPHGISEAELDGAFADAEPEVERMRSADDVAEQAMLQADQALEAEGELAPDEVGEHFATETMAHLLERQGDDDGAERIRAALDLGDGETPRTNRGNVVSTLERWLENLRGGARS
jgi:hypothetical protein